MPPLYLLHPMAVHFPIAILTLGLAVGAAASFSVRRPWLSEAASWLLWLGALASWVAMGLGLLAAKTAPHVPPAWEVMADHKTSAFWTVGLFTALSLWRFWMGRRFERLFLVAWLIAALVLLATAYYGGELVFTFGVAGPQWQ